jgi:hypothetical protein
MAELYECTSRFFQLPTDGSNPKLDVLFNIHSGAFMYGWGHEFGPEILMDRDIIWVTINYRLGAFGKPYKYIIYLTYLLTP